MTAPRQILPGATYLFTRRCSERRYLLRPSRAVNAVFLYVLATAARRFGLRIHAFCVLSNHVHLVLSDPDARLPAFAQYLGSLVARATNALLGRWEAFWAPGSYSAVRLESPDDVVAKAAYALANPVAARLVRRGREWPGLRTAPEQVGGYLTAPRPESFFRRRGQLPAEAELELTVPPGFASAEEFRERLASAVRELEDAARGRGVLGAARVLAQRPLARPAAAEPRRELSPRVAARDRWKRIEALCRLQSFLEAYRAAWVAAAWRARRGVPGGHVPLARLAWREVRRGIGRPPIAGPPARRRRDLPAARWSGGSIRVAGFRVPESPGRRRPIPRRRGASGSARQGPAFAALEYGEAAPPRPPSAWSMRCRAS